MREDDPLDRLAAEEDWAKRGKAIARRHRFRFRVHRPRAIRLGISKIFLALVATSLASAVALWIGAGPADVLVFIFVLAAWLVTLCLHEFSHALTAYRGGDHTVPGKGYLRLDPRKYGHPFLTLILPLFFLVIGGLPLPGGAVWIESHRLRNRFRDALVSAAGPAVNIVAAIVLLGIVSLLGPEAIFAINAPRAPFWAALTLLAYLQVATAILNLLPVPGLDGYGMIEPYLPGGARLTGQKIKPYGLILLFLLLYIPPVRFVFEIVVDFFFDLGGPPVNGAYYGYELFQFYRFW